LDKISGERRWGREQLCEVDYHIAKGKTLGGKVALQIAGKNKKGFCLQNSTGGVKEAGSSQRGFY